MSESNEKNEPITAKDLAEQTKTILEAVDFSLQKQSAEKVVDKKLNTQVLF